MVLILHFYVNCSLTLLLMKDCICVGVNWKVQLWIWLHYKGMEVATNISNSQILISHHQKASTLFLFKLYLILLRGGEGGINERYNLTLKIYKVWRIPAGFAGYQDVKFISTYITVHRCKRALEWYLHYLFSLVVFLKLALKKSVVLFYSSHCRKQMILK